MTLKPNPSGRSAAPHKPAQDVPELPENLDGLTSAEIKRLFHALRQRIAELEMAQAGQKGLETPLQEMHELQLITDTVVAVSRMENIDEICQRLAETVHALNPGSQVAVSLYDRALDAIRGRAFIIPQGLVSRVVDILGVEPGDIQIQPSEMGQEARLYTTGKVECVPNGLYDLMIGRLPRTACRALEKLFGIGAFYVVGFALGEVPYGGVIIMTPKGQDIRYPSTIETLASHFSVIIQHQQAKEALRDSNRHLQQALKELQAAQAQMIQQERLAAVGQLASGIAHDFRNLLTTITLNTHLALRKHTLPPDLTRKLEVVLGESKKAADLVQQILDFSSRSMIQVRPIDLQTLTQSVVDMLRRTLAENIQLSLNIAPDAQGASPLIVQADPGRIEQALMNLALNARDAMPDGGTLCFTLSRREPRPGNMPSATKERPLASPPQTGSTEQSRWVCLSISDTGTGMTEQVRAHLFEPFFTTKEVGQGTGLGLAQVYGIVRQHEGYIDVETAVGAGTTFYIYLPVSETVHEYVDEDIPDIPQGKGETILLVEDNQMLRQAAQSILESLGHRVLSAANGREALAAYAVADKVDLVITDMVMPEMGGKALMRALRHADPHLKGLVITGYAVEQVPETLRALGVLDVIHKPFQIDTLARAVRRALDAG